MTEKDYRFDANLEYNLDDKQNILSVVLSNIPGANHVHPNRLQMSSNFHKQAIGIKGMEEPLLRTPYASAISRFSEIFDIKAPFDGIVRFVSDRFILLENPNEKEYQNRFHLAFLDPAPLFKNNIFAQVGQKVKAGQTLARHIMLSKDGIPKLGTHLNTVFSFAIGDVIKKEYGMTFEDAIVISESAAEKLKSFQIKSLYIEINKPFFQINPKLRIGAKFNAYEYIVRQYADITNLIPEDEKLPFNFYVYNIQAFIMDEKILSRIDSRSRDILKQYDVSNQPELLKASICEKIKSQFKSEKQFSSFCKDLEKYLLLKQKSILHHQRRGSALRAILIIDILYVDELKVGDKLANRYGNKGVVSLIMPDRDIKKFFEHAENIPDDFQPEIVINPYGVHSRMNVMQVVEQVLLYLQKYVIPEKVKEIVTNKGYSEAFNWILQEIIKPLNEDYYASILETLHSLSAEERDRLIKASIDDVIQRGLVLELEPFEYNLVYKVYKLAQKLQPQLLVNFKLLENANLAERANILSKFYGYGVMYWLKLEHRVETKHKTAGAGPYNRKNGMPTEGYKFGEMETWTFLAYDALNSLQEIIGPRADNHDAKQHQYNSIILTGLSTIHDEPIKQGKSLAFELFADYMAILGIDLYHLQDVFAGNSSIEQHETIKDTDTAKEIEDLQGQDISAEIFTDSSIDTTIPEDDEVLENLLAEDNSEDDSEAKEKPMQKEVAEDEIDTDEILNDITEDLEFTNDEEI